MLKFNKLTLNEDIDNSPFEIDSKGNNLSKEQSNFFKNSKIRNKEGKLLVCYHGTISDFKEFNSPINWFTLSTSYSNQFANFRGEKDKQKTYEVYLNCKKFLNCGDTSGNVFDLLHISSPLKLSPKIQLIFNKLGLNEEQAREFIKKVVDERDKEGYILDNKEDYEKKLKIHVLTRTKAFKDLVQSKGYDSITTIEDGYRCFGVFNPNDIKYISNKTPTTNNNIDESLRMYLINNLYEELFNEESDSKKTYRSSLIKKWFSKKNPDKALHSGATLHHLKTSKNDIFSKLSAKSSDEDYIKALNNSVIIDVGDEENNTRFNDVIHRLWDLMNGNAGSKELEKLFQLIREANVYYYEGNVLQSKKFKEVANSKNFQFDKEEFNNLTNESQESSMNEDIEKHDTLNPKLWNEDNTLKEEVRDKILQIVDEFTNELKQDNIKFDIKDIRLVGSNCSFNYTKDSDLDVHIIMKEDSLDCPYNLYPLIYSSYRSIFNRNLDIDFYEIPVEIYVEME